MKPTALLEVIGGELPTKIFHAMPMGSWLYCFGSLSGQQYSVGAGTLLFQQKVLTSFMLGGWYDNISKEERENVNKMIIDDLGSGGAVFGTHIVKEFSLDKWATAVEESFKIASEGKVIIRPQLKE